MLGATAEEEGSQITQFFVICAKSCTCLLLLYSDKGTTRECQFRELILYRVDFFDW